MCSANSCSVLKVEFVLAGALDRHSQRDVELPGASGHGRAELLVHEYPRLCTGRARSDGEPVGLEDDLLGFHDAFVDLGRDRRRGAEEPALERGAVVEGEKVQRRVVARCHVSQSSSGRYQWCGATTVSIEAGPQEPGA